MAKEIVLATEAAVAWLQEVVDCMKSGGQDVKYVQISVTYSFRCEKGIETNAYSWKQPAVNAEGG